MKRIAVIVFTTTVLLSSCGVEESTVQTIIEPPIAKTLESYDVDKVDLGLITVSEPVEEPTSEVEEVEEVEVAEPIEFRVTAYCPCEKCCGRWALNRPKDENGNPIVIGAWNKELTTNYSVASPLPFGTKIDLGELGVVEVQDRTADWVVDKFGENIIDIYMTNHDEARQFGLQYIEGTLIN